MNASKSDLRRRLRTERRAIDEREQMQAAHAVASRLEAFFDDRVRIAAAYVATDGEVSPHVAIERLRHAGVDLALPLVADDRMTFHVVESFDQLVVGAYGLSEPPPSCPIVEPADLDLVLVPLVGFDNRCNRMGRGKAYYDTAFGFVPHTRLEERPLLVGLAHDVQRVDQLAVEPHDVRLDAVVTPTTVHR